MTPLSEPVQISIISTMGGITTAYIINVLAKKVQERRAKAEPKDRVEQIFDIYDRALKQKDADIDELRQTLKEAQHQLREVERKLNHSYQINSQLQGQLERLRIQYHLHKKDGSPDLPDTKR